MESRHVLSCSSRLSMGVGSPVIADPDRIEQLYWIDRNLLKTLSTLHYSSYHAAFVHYLSDALHHPQPRAVAVISRNLGQSGQLA